MVKIVVRGYVPLRRGLAPHLKFMSSSEVKLFDIYLLWANHRTAICMDSNAEIAKILGWKEGTVSSIRQKLIARHFVIPNRPGLAGVWINKYPKDRGTAYVDPPEWAVEFMEKHPLEKIGESRRRTPLKKQGGIEATPREKQGGTPREKQGGHHYSRSGSKSSVKQTGFKSKKKGRMMTKPMRDFMTKMKVRFRHHFPNYGQLEDEDILLLLVGSEKYKWRIGNLCPEYLPPVDDPNYIKEEQKFLLEALDVAAESVKMAGKAAKRMGKKVQPGGSMKRIILAGLRGGHLEWLRHATKETLLRNRRRSPGSERSLGQIFKQIQKHGG